MAGKAPKTRSKYITDIPYKSKVSTSPPGKPSRTRMPPNFYKPPGPSEIRRIITKKKGDEIQKENARREVVPHMIGSDSKNVFACFMWSIGDRYHDWWPADRGDIKSFKKCGSWKFLPDIIRYGIIAESIRAINRMRASPNNMTTLINDSGITQCSVVGNSTSYANTRPSSILNKLKKYTLGKYLTGKGDIETIILNKFSTHKPINISISSSLLKLKKGDYNKIILKDAIKKYKNICDVLFGKNHGLAWFAVVCDAGHGPFCKLFINIIDIIMNDYRITYPSRNNYPIDIIIHQCKLKRIPVMYMIKTPQTFADSGLSSSFIDCLILHRFPINDNIPDLSQISPPPYIYPSYRSPSYITPPYSYQRIPNSVRPPLSFRNRISSFFRIRGGVRAVHTIHRVRPVTYPDNRVMNNDGVFECKFNYFSNDIYKIMFIREANYNQDEYAFSYCIYMNNNPVFKIPYGLIDGNKYRYKGPSLYELILHYLHLNLSQPQNIYNTSITDGTYTYAFNQIFSKKDIYYTEKYSDRDENDDEDNGNDSKIDDDNKQNLDEILKVNIHQSIDSALGLVDSPVTTGLPRVIHTTTTGLPVTIPDGKGKKTDITYTPIKHNSLAILPGYSTLEPRVMIDIKHEGDASQVVAAYLLNKTGDCKNKIVFISKDRPCVAHSINKGLRTINFSGNEIFVYNYKHGSQGGGSYTRKNHSMQKGGQEEDLDLQELMLTIGMYASKYIHDIFEKEIDKNLHYNVLTDLYDDILHICDENNTNILNIIELEYNDIYIQKFVTILHTLYYKTKVNSLGILTELSDIYNNYSVNSSDNLENVNIPRVNLSNTRKLKNTQNLANNMVKTQQNRMNYFKKIKDKKMLNMITKTIKNINNKATRNATQNGTRKSTRQTPMMSYQLQPILGY